MQYAKLRITGWSTRLNGKPKGSFQLRGLGCNLVLSPSEPTRFVAAAAAASVTRVALGSGEDEEHIRLQQCSLSICPCFENLDLEVQIFFPVE